MIYTEERHLKIILNILAKYPYTFYAFGSRARGNPKKFSDLDLCFIEYVPLHILSDIKEDFEESKLPYTVDVVDWNKCKQDFKDIIRKDLVRIQGDKEIPQ